MKKILLLAFLFLAFKTNAQLPVLSLEEAINQALSKNFGIKTLRNDLTIATNNATKAAVGFLPNVNLTVTEAPSIGFVNQKFAGRDAINRTNIANNLNAGVQMQWVLYDGKRMFLELDRLKEVAALSDLAIKIRSEQIVYDVMRAYYSVVRNQELYRGLQEQIDLYEERYRLAQTRLDVGKGNQLDVLQAQADLNVQKTSLLRQQQEITIAKLLLKQLLTEGVQTVFDVRDTFSLATKLDYNRLKTNALNQNLTIELLKRQGGISTLLMKQIEAQQKPRVSFNPSFTVGRTDNTAGLFLLNQTAGLNAGVTLTYPIYDAGNLKRQANNAKIEIESNKIRQQELSYNLESNLNLAYQNYLNALDILRGEEENKRIAQQSIIIAMERYRLSRSTVLELKQIQQGYEAAVFRAVSAKFEAKMSEVEMMRLSGQLIR